MAVKTRWPGMNGRWERLVNTLAEAGIAAEVDRSVWCGELVCNITMRVGDGLVTIRDTAWRDHWTGWQVCAEDVDSIVVREFPKTKNRGEVARLVEAAHTALGCPL